MNRTAPGPAPYARVASSSARITSARRPIPKYELEFILMNSFSGQEEARTPLSLRRPDALHDRLDAFRRAGFDERVDMPP